MQNCHKMYGKEKIMMILYVQDVDTKSQKEKNSLKFTFAYYWCYFFIIYSHYGLSNNGSYKMGVQDGKYNFTRGC